LLQWAYSSIIEENNMPEKEVWDIYPEIYHYTSFENTLSIIQSAELWATRFDLLNDTQELIYAKKIISQKLLEKFPGATLEDAEQDLDNIFYEAMGADIYITSFCGKDSNLDSTHHANGLLSMWRCYGADGGCSIVFKTKNIYDQTNYFRKSFDSPPALLMDQIIYEGQNDDKPEYRERLNRFTYNASKFIKNREDRDSYSMEEICVNQLYLMMITKHPAFIDEREVRRGLCFLKKAQENPEQAQPSPKYHPIPFSPDKDISRIIIGPHKDQLKRYESLKSHLANRRLENIEVTKSDIPMRT